MEKNEESQEEIVLNLEADQEETEEAIAEESLEAEEFLP